MTERNRSQAMTDKGPRTAEGRALLLQVAFGFRGRVATEIVQKGILAIEDAAFAQGIAAARAAVEELLSHSFESAHLDDNDMDAYEAVLDKLAALDSTDGP